MACSRANPFFIVAGLTSHILLLTHYDLNREDENLNLSSTMQYFASHMPDTVSNVKTRKWRAQEVARTVRTRSPHRVCVRTRGALVTTDIVAELAECVPNLLPISGFNVMLACVSAGA